MTINSTLLYHFHSEFHKTHQGMHVYCINEKYSNDDGLHVGGDCIINKNEYKRYFGNGVFLTGWLDVKAGEYSAGGCLLAARVLELESPTVLMHGTKDDPVVVVGLEKLSINVIEKGIFKNVNFYLLEGSTFELNIPNDCNFKNIKVFSVKWEEGKPSIRHQLYW